MSITIRIVSGSIGKFSILQAASIMVQPCSNSQWGPNCMAYTTSNCSVASMTIISSNALSGAGAAEGVNGSWSCHEHGLDLHAHGGDSWDSE